MKESIANAYLYMVIIIFLLIVFGFAGGLITYQKAYKVNSKIANAIEKAEGYNDISIEEINRTLGTLGYRGNDNKSCPERDGELLTNDANKPNYKYCVYQTKFASKDDPYDQYMIYTYIFIDLPVVNEFKISIKSKTASIYHFNCKEDLCVNR